MLLIILIAVLSLLAQLVLSWWSIGIVAFAVCFWRSKTGNQAFLAGFIGVALVWQIFALFIHIQSGGILTNKMSQLLFKATMPVVLLELTVFIGGIVGGFAALSGHLCRRALMTPAG